MVGPAVDPAPSTVRAHNSSRITACMWGMRRALGAVQHARRRSVRSCSNMASSPPHQRPLVVMVVVVLLAVVVETVEGGGLSGLAASSSRRSSSH